MKQSTTALILLVMAVLLLQAPAGAQDLQLEDMVVEHTTPNGMKFLLIDRETAPVFSAVIQYRVGGVDEPLGQTGVAHMYEHMAFKGTPIVGIKDYAAEKPLLERINQLGEEITFEVAKGELADASRIQALQSEKEILVEQHKQLVVKDELWDTYLRHGGTGLNASTSKDVTTYYISLPNNRLEMWALMEAQRMQAPVLREFYSERDVVAEERRMRTETNPGGMLYEQFIAAAYTAHPYGTPTIGWMQDINNLTASGAREFFQKYYSPSNAVAAIVGDIDIDETIEIVDKYFGAVESAPPPPEVAIEEPEQKGERRVVVEWDAQPQIMIGYHKPTLPHKDDYVFDVIDSILTRGRTSRLYTEAIKEKKMARYISTFGAPGSRYNNLFVIASEPIEPFTTADIEELVYAELDRLATEPVSERELEKVRNQIVADSIRALNSNMGLARQLTYFQSVGGDWRYLVDYVENISQVTAEDIMRVAAEYFRPRNRTVAVIQKVEEAS